MAITSKVTSLFKKKIQNLILLRKRNHIHQFHMAFTS